MNRRIISSIVTCCLACSGFATIARAAGDFVILGEGNAFWTNNTGAPICKELIKLQKGHTFHSVGFTPTGDWVALMEGNGYYTSNTDLPACKKLTELQEGKNTFECAAFAPSGGWTVLWNQNGNWTEGSIPDEAFKKMQEVVKGGGTLRSVAFGPNGAWVVLFDKTGIWCGNIPDDLGKVFDNAIKNSLTVRCVCFTTSGTWICLTNNGWWTSDVNHPASKMIADLDRQHQSLHWVAVAPEIGPHDFNNNNFYIARLVLEQTGHVQYTPYVKEHVLKPMGITRMETHFQATEPMCGYGKPGTTRPGFPFDWDCDATAGAAGWYGSITELGDFLLGLRDHKVLSPATTDMMYKDLLGWDTSDPGWEKNGGWFWDEGSAPGARAGAFRSSIFHFPDDVDAVLLINSDTPNAPEDILRQAWTESMQK